MSNRILEEYQVPMPVQCAVMRDQVPYWRVASRPRTCLLPVPPKIKLEFYDEPMRPDGLPVFHGGDVSRFRVDNFGETLRFEVSVDECGDFYGKYLVYGKLLAVG